MSTTTRPVYRSGRRTAPRASVHGERSRILLPIVLVVVASAVQLVSAGAAWSFDKDPVLRNLAERQEVPIDGETRFNAYADTDAFRGLSKDLGLVFAPKYLAPAETLGEAGFDVGFNMSLSTVDAKADYWRGLEGGEPSPFVTAQAQVRKGVTIPYLVSLEVGGAVTWLIDSELVALGTDVKWALNEGFFYLPDLALRGSLTNVVGSSDMNLTTAGFDLSISKSWGLFGLVNVTPYAGYNRLWVISSSRLLDVAPEDPRPPIIRECDPADLGCTEDLAFQPEFVFDTEIQSLNRYFLGSRFVFGYASITLEGAFSDTVNSYSARVGFDF